MGQYTFEHCRRAAHGQLGDAAEWISWGDWPPLTDEQDAARREALRLIGQARAALDKAAG